MPVVNSLIASTLMLFNVLVPSKLWYPPDQPITINVKAEAPVKLVLVDFLGRAIDTQADVNVDGPKDVDLRKLYPAMATGTYLLYAVPKDKNLPDFVGTPLVVQTRADARPNARPGPIVTRVEPLRYATMDTSEGSITMAFYYDLAPNTVDNFLRLSEEGFYNDQVFHRIIKNFVIQGGDPLGTDPERAGTGGPGFNIDQEFNERQHQKGVLSMARQGDPMEAQGMMPRSEAANSASSQFFICLDYAKTKALDGRYTAFGKVVGGMDVVDKIAALPTGKNDRPNNPPVIKKVTVETVTPGKNPYTKLFASEEGDVVQPK